MYAPLAAVSPSILLRRGGFPIDLDHKLEGKAAFRDITDVFSEVECDIHFERLRYSINLGKAMFGVVAITCADVGEGLRRGSTAARLLPRRRSVRLRS